MAVEVVTYGNGNLLADVLNAVTVLTDVGDGDFLSLLRLMLMLTGFVAGLEMAFTGTFKPAPRVLFFILIFNALLVPRTTVQVTDKIMPWQAQSIDNAPAGVAYVFSYASLIGAWTTEKFETVFSLPNDVRYQDNGFLFGARLAEATRDFTIRDPEFAANLSEFLQSCVYYGTLVGWFKWPELQESDDLWNTIKTQGVGNAIFTNQTWSTEPVGCKDAFEKLDEDWDDQINRMEKEWGRALFPGLDGQQAGAKLAAALPSSMDFLTTASKDAADWLKQSAMIRHMKRANSGFLARHDATAAMQDFAVAQAEAQQRGTYHTVAAVIAEWMPLMRNVIEALVLGLFPLIVIILLIARDQGKFFLWYLKTVVWLQLWAPMYAILHYVMMDQLADSSTAVVATASGNVLYSMLTSGALQSVSADMSALGGYLTTMVPMLAYSVVMGGGFAMAQAVGSLGSVMQSAGGAAGAQAAKGNVDMGNFRAYNSSMFQQNHSPSFDSGVAAVRDPNTGTVTTTTAGGGHQFMAQLSSSGPMSMAVGGALKSSVSTMASQSVEAAKNDLTAYAQSAGANWANTEKLVQATSQDTTAGAGWRSQDGASLSAAYQQAQSVINDFAKEHGITSKQAAQVLAGAEFGASAPSFSPVDISGKIGITGKSEEQLQEMWKGAQRVSGSEQYQQAMGRLNDAVRTTGTDYSMRTGDSSAQELTAGMQRQAQLQEQAQASIREANAWQQTKGRIEELGASWNQQAFDMFKNWASQYSTRGMQGVDEMIARANQGDPAARRDLDTFTARFTQEVLPKMAGVESAPTADAVYARHEATSEALRGRGEAGVEAADGANRADVRNATEGAGVPTKEGVQNASAGLIGHIEQLRAGHSSGVESGRERVEGASQREAASIRAYMDANKDALLAGAMKGGYQQMMSGVPEAFRGTVDKWFAENGAPPSGGGASVPGGPQNDGWSGARGDVPPPPSKVK